jgi:predicted sulfurtransferase
MIGDKLEVVRMRKKSNNAQRANTTFKPDKYEKELPIIIMVDDYNHYKVEVGTYD